MAAAGADEISTVTEEDKKLFQKVLKLVKDVYFSTDNTVKDYVKTNFVETTEKLSQYDEWPSEYRMGLKPAKTGTTLSVHPHYLQGCTSFALAPAYINAYGERASCAFILRIGKDPVEMFYIYNTADAGSYLLHKIFPKNENGSIKTKAEAEPKVDITDVLRRMLTMLESPAAVSQP